MTTPSSHTRAQSSWKLDELLAALELSENGFMRFDVKGRCVAVNECAARALGRQPESWLGKTIAQVAPESIGTPFEQAFQRCRSEGGLIVIEKEYYPPRDRWYQSRFLRTSHDAVLICFRDITDQVHLEDLQAELCLEAGSRERFEGILAHDLRNPLTTITFAAAALVRAAELTEPQARAIRRIAASAGRISRMIDSLLDLTRTRGGGEIPIALQPTDLRSICRQGVAEDEMADRTAAVLNQYGAVNVGRRAQVTTDTKVAAVSPQKAVSQPAAPKAVPPLATQRPVTPPPAQKPIPPSPASGTIAVSAQTIIPVIQEELEIGKRIVERGGVRVHSHIKTMPIEEVIRLREEHVEVERRTVNRPLSASDAFEEVTIEMTETVEEAVVAKQARVVEEVVIGKKAEEHDEKIKETVRRQDVEVEQLPRTGTGGRR